MEIPLREGGTEWKQRCCLQDLGEKLADKYIATNVLEAHQKQRRKHLTKDRK